MSEPQAYAPWSVKGKRFLVCCLCCLWLAPLFSWAAIDVYQFESEAQEQRYRTLINELSCPKCQNQPISESNAQIAEDMRHIAAEMLREGHSDADIIEFFRARYGDFIHYRPPLYRNTLLLWWAPGLLLGLGILIVVRLIRRAATLPQEEDSTTGDEP